MLRTDPWHHHRTLRRATIIRCPRCGQKFYVKGTVYRQVATKCLHCGEKKYADVGAPDESRGSVNERKGDVTPVNQQTLASLHFRCAPPRLKRTPVTPFRIKRPSEFAIRARIPRTKGSWSTNGESLSGREVSPNGACAVSCSCTRPCL